jgi:hypothetical protein
LFDYQCTEIGNGWKIKEPSCAEKYQETFVTSQLSLPKSGMDGSNEDWFLHFVPEVQSFLEKNDMLPKALFLLNNAPSHPSMSILTSEDGNIFVLYLPPNVTSIAHGSGRYGNNEKPLQKKIDIKFVRTGS